MMKMEDKFDDVLKKVINHINDGEEVSFCLSVSGMDMVLDVNECPLNEDEKSTLHGWVFDELMNQNDIFCTPYYGCEFKFETWKKDGKLGLDLIGTLNYHEIYTEDGYYEEEEYEKIVDVFSYYYE